MEDKANSGAVATTGSADASQTPVKKAAKSKAKVNNRPKASHPPTSEMVTAAIKGLKDRKGSSLQAIKKYIVTTYKVDGEKLAPFIKRYLKAAVTSGTVVQTKGKGASGSFKLSVPKPEGKPKAQKSAKDKVKVTKKKTAVKPASPKKVTKKPVAEKKPVAAQKKTTKAAAATEKVRLAAEAAKPKKAAAQPKALSKTKKTAKAPAAKTKTPKPKKTATPRTVRAAAKK